MRIIGGKFRGRRLDVPTNDVRPTTDRTREAVFSLLLARISLEEVRVLDLFAGSGALGLEALSRGAGSAVFVESNSRVVRVIRANAEALGVTDQSTIVRSDAFRYLNRGGERFAVVFADPPYDLPGIERLPDLVLSILEPEGLFVLEHGPAQSFAEHPELVTTRTYGRTVVSIFGHLT